MDHNNEQISSMRLSQPKSLLFNVFSADEVTKLSVVKIITPLSFNVLGHPLPGGLYDPAMGPVGFGSVCTTCGMMQMKCGGHLGRIELPLPVLNPLYHKSVGAILKMSCLECHRILVPHSAKCLLIGKLTLLHHGNIVEAQAMDDMFVDLVEDSTWNSKFEYEQSTATKIIDYVNDIRKEKEGVDKEWKGEVDLRNAYIKTALSQVFKGKTCPFCKQPFKKLAIVQNNILVPTKMNVAVKFRGTKPLESGSEIISSNFTFLMPSDCREHLKKLYDMDGEFIKALLPILVNANIEDPIASLFMEVLPVPPISARPINTVNGVMTEHPQNAIYKAILNDCLVLRSIAHLMNTDGDTSLADCSLSKERLEVVEQLRGNTYADKLQYSWQSLQRNVDSLMDIDSLNSRNPDGLGLKQIIEKKEGIIRMNMMGKRVNFAARTVITPDPNINIDEIGIPEAFALKLTYPVPVTYYNVSEMRRLVINGPYLHPGANLVENEDGSIVKLNGDDLIQREGIAKKLLTPSDKKGIKIVHRHLVNGDILLFNRQPTLHKPSIMAHKARVLKGEKTFRMHYANCKSYNADFDGDEMNAHFPQNEVARSEGYNLVSVNKQYLVPKDGTPLSGLIQDHVISGVRLSQRGTLFTREEYMQLTFQGLSSLTGDIKYLPPCMIKPQRLWSGKQIISTIILNSIPKGCNPINLMSKAKISASAWHSSRTKHWRTGVDLFTSPEVMTEAEVVIRCGELLCGVLDKKHYGATPYSLVHCVHELYGGESAAKLLSAFSKLFTAFLQTEGFSLGVEDILVVKNADKQRKVVIDSVRKIGETIAIKALDVAYKGSLTEDLAEAHKKDSTFRALLDHQYKVSLDSFTNDINKACLPRGLLKPFPANDLQLMVQSGAKGSTVNTMQISCLLGQIELEGKRPPLMISGRSLPSFPPYDPSPRAGGFIDGRFMTGIQPQEFFFHCMAGREGLIDTAVKTSRSGYLQRCLVKHLEGLTVNYDLTVRDSDGSVVQFLYGEDGMEVTKCQFLTQQQLPFLADNIQASFMNDVVEFLKEGSDLKGIKTCRKQLKKWRKSAASVSKQKPSPFSLYSQHANLETKKSKKLNADTGRAKYADEMISRWHAMDGRDKEKYKKMCQVSPDPLVSKLQPDRHFGSVTEKMDFIIDNYMKTRANKVDSQIIEDVIHLKALSALANPGEPVGLLAAQSVGEPSTQMTLNTFHFAGRGEMNVTLGIPRLREVLMVASKNIKTPSMEIPFKTKVHKLEKHAEHLRKKLAKVTLADVLETVEVREKLQIKPKRRQIYILKFNFLPKEAYKEMSTVSSKKVLKHFEKKFVKELLGSIKKTRKRTGTMIDTEKDTKSGRKGNDGDDDDADDPPPKRGGVAGAGNDHLSSDEEEENDDDDATAARRRERQTEEHQYSDIEDEDDDVRQEIEGTKVKRSNTDEEDEDNEGPKVDRKEEGDRKANVTSYDNVVSYSFDTHNQQWCELTLAYPMALGRVDFSVKLKTLASSSVITHVPGIRKAFIMTKPNGDKFLKTDGKNLREMYDYQHLLDVNRLYTNDIHAVAETYGIEAASKAIVKEVQEVFKVYGITVDPRHLSLIADYMTFDGTFRPLSRMGMEGGSSPLQQMSFEASLGFLKSSVLRSKRDDLLSPSARLMLGRPVSSGTSSFSLLYSLSEGQIY